MVFEIFSTFAEYRLPYYSTSIVMKRILLLFVSLVSLMFVACETDDHQDLPAYDLRVTTSQEVSVGCGSVVGFINYTLERAADTEIIYGDSVHATADVEWVTALDCSVYGKVTYHIARNESSEPRVATVTLFIRDVSCDVVITQAGVAPDTVVEAPMVTGHYYGTKATSINNYYVCFSDNGLDYRNLTCKPDTYYYIVDLFLDAEPVDGNFRVPDGVYTYDGSSGASGTFAYFSWYQENDSRGNAVLQRRYTSGTLTVEGCKLTLSVMLEATDAYPSERYIVKFDGDYALVDMSR